MLQNCQKILQRNFALLKIYFSGFLWSNISWPRSPPSSAQFTTITVRGALRKITWKSEAVRYKGNITEARRPPFGPGRNFPDRCSHSLAFFPTRVYNIHCIYLYSFLAGASADKKLFCYSSWWLDFVLVDLWWSPGGQRNTPSQVEIL